MAFGQVLCYRLRSRGEEDFLSDTASESDDEKKIKKYPVNDIKAGSYFSEPLYLEKQFILAAPEMPFSAEMKKALEEWEFGEVFSAGDPMEDYAANKSGQAEGGELSETSALSDRDKIIRAEEFYAAFVKYVESLFTQAAINNELFFKPVAEKIKTACDIIREDRRFLLRVQKNNLSSPYDNYLASHAVKSTIISIIIGSYLKLPNHRLIELGVAALLHEIGMIKLPPQMYLSKRPLQPQEKKAILTHPVLSYNLLKSFDFPLTVNLAALEQDRKSVV
jgi:HD-GYP domain-containing protein (c-di-GMP phosphodiesterase class II)